MRTHIIILVFSLSNTLGLSVDSGLSAVVSDLSVVVACAGGDVVGAAVVFVVVGVSLIIL
jgi:hypothetical protein